MTFLNTSVQLVILNVIFWKSELGSRLWENNGLANDLWFLLLLTILDLVVSFLKPRYFMKLLYRRWLEKGNKVQSFRPTQKQANQIYEGFDYYFDEQLAKYCKTLLITLFITSLFPLAPLIALVYIMVYYWCDKIFLIRFCKVPNFCTSQIGHSMLHFLDLALVVYSVLSSN
jgi:hypothetical protein